MPTSATETGTTCHCADPEVDQLRDLIAAGVGQREATRMLWGPPCPTPPPITPPFADARPVSLFRWIGLRDRST